jgi:hypothetical protein
MLPRAARLEIVRLAGDGPTGVPLRGGILTNDKSAICLLKKNAVPST